jgi:hypothetical protein
MHKNFYLALLLLMPLSLHAELYKGVDEEGNVTFSDKETPNSEVIPMHMPTAIPMPKPVPVEKSPEKEVAETNYTAFTIVQPVNDATIRNNTGSVSVSLSLTPALDTSAGHHISVSVDGKVIIKNSASLTVPLTNIERGSHSIQATVKNKKGKTIKTSNSVTVHLKRIGLTPVPHARIHPQDPNVIIYSGAGPDTVTFRPGPILPRAQPLDTQ